MLYKVKKLFRLQLEGSHPAIFECSCYTWHRNCTRKNPLFSRDVQTPFFLSNTWTFVLANTMLSINILATCAVINLWRCIQVYRMLLGSNIVPVWELNKSRNIGLTHILACSTQHFILVSVSESYYLSKAYALETLFGTLTGKMLLVQK